MITLVNKKFDTLYFAKGFITPDINVISKFILNDCNDFKERVPDPLFHALYLVPFIKRISLYFVKTLMEL